MAAKWDRAVASRPPPRRPLMSREEGVKKSAAVSWHIKGRRGKGISLGEKWREKFNGRRKPTARY